MKKITLIIEENKDGFWAQLKGYPNVFTQGDTLDELKANAKEALNLYLEESGKATFENVQFEFVYDIREFFEVNDYINITKLAERTGINPSLLRQYARGIKFPGVKQIEKIQKTIREVGAELTKSTITSTIN
jgi:predicted RNase H-like HicB family nuclease